MKQLFVFFALFCLSTSLLAQSISHIETTRSWYYVYDQNGNKIKTLNSSIGELQGYSSTIFVVKSGSWYYVYDAKGNKIKTLSVNSVGKILNVAGDTFTSKSGSWIYTWNKDGKKISTRFASH